MTFFPLHFFTLLGFGVFDRLIEVGWSWGSSRLAAKPFVCGVVVASVDEEGVRIMLASSPTPNTDRSEFGCSCSSRKPLLFPGLLSIDVGVVGEVAHLLGSEGIVGGDSVRTSIKLCGAVSQASAPPLTPVSASEESSTSGATKNLSG